MRGLEDTGHRMRCLGLFLASPLLASRPLYLLAVAGGQVTSRRESRNFCRCFITAFFASADPLEVRLQLGSLPAPSRFYSLRLDSRKPQKSDSSD